MQCHRKCGYNANNYCFKPLAQVYGCTRQLVNPWLKYIQPPTKDFPFWYYDGPWPNEIKEG